MDVRGASEPERADGALAAPGDHSDGGVDTGGFVAAAHALLKRITRPDRRLRP